MRFRIVVSHLEPSDAFAFAPSGFHHPTTTVFASIVDHTFGPRFDRWWLGAGLEIWLRGIEHEGVPDTTHWFFPIANRN